MSGTIVTFPSSALPAPPSFTFDVPDRWVLHEFPGTLATASVVTADDDSVWINVQVRHERVARDLTLETAALASWARLTVQAPHATIDLERKGTFGGKEAFLRSAFLNADDAPAPAVQLDALFFGPDVGENSKDLFHMVGTVDAPTLLGFTEVFLQALKSFTFTD